MSVLLWVAGGVVAGALAGALVGWGGARVGALVPAFIVRGETRRLAVIGGAQGAAIGALAQAALLARYPKGPRRTAGTAVGLFIRLLSGAIICGGCVGVAALLITGFGEGYPTPATGLFALVPTVVGLHSGLYLGGIWHLLVAGRTARPNYS